MKFFRCSVEVENSKKTPHTTEIFPWVVKGENAEVARMRLERYFRENHLTGKYRRIVAIEFVEIELSENEDIEEYLERRGGSTLNVLF